MRNLSAYNISADVSTGAKRLEGTSTSRSTQLNRQECYLSNIYYNIIIITHCKYIILQYPVGPTTSNKQVLHHLLRTYDVWNSSDRLWSNYYIQLITDYLHYVSRWYIPTQESSENIKNDDKNINLIFSFRNRLFLVAEKCVEHFLRRNGKYFYSILIVFKRILWTAGSNVNTDPPLWSVRNLGKKVFKNIPFS